MSKVHILQPDVPTLVSLIETLGEKRFRANQISDWIYKKGVIHPEAMTNVGKSLQQKLLDAFSFQLPEIISHLDAADGTTKLLLRSQTKHLIETVIMRYPGRVTLCVSSQVGCKLSCSFCQTGKLGFFRHLEVEEILAQLHIANDILRSEGRRVSNIVFMGMGEPLDNFDKVISAVNRMIGESAYNLSARHVTVSTSGLVPQIMKLASHTKAELAVSLHAADDQVRTSLMPINRKYPLALLKQALMEHQKTSSRKITIEYILIKDQTCNLGQAKKLVKFLHGLRAKVNLIPFNDHPGSEYQRPPDEEIREFQKHLADRSYPAPVRYSRGMDVSAACGQLAAKSIGELASEPSRAMMVSKLN